jgi:hypothetical protein
VQVDAYTASIMTKHKYFRFALSLSYDQYLTVYQGIAKNVSVTADDGKVVSFPARKVQAFLTKQGINGFFEMEITAENKFVSIKKLK